MEDTLGNRNDVVSRALDPYPPRELVKILSLSFFVSLFGFTFKIIIESPEHNFSPLTFCEICFVVKVTREPHKVLCANRKARQSIKSAWARHSIKVAFLKLDKID